MINQLTLQDFIESYNDSNNNHKVLNQTFVFNWAQVNNEKKAKEIEKLQLRHNCTKYAPSTIRNATPKMNFKIIWENVQKHRNKQSTLLQNARSSFIISSRRNAAVKIWMPNGSIVTKNFLTFKYAAAAVTPSNWPSWIFLSIDPRHITMSNDSLQTLCCPC